ILVTAQRLEMGGSKRSLTLQYQSLIRLGEAIRSHRDQKDLFHGRADALRDVVPFDGICQCDPTGNKVNWHFSEPYNSDDHRISNIPREETVGWWVNRTQQSVAIQVDNQETRFRATIDLLSTKGLRSLCALPLSTAHRQLGSLVFVSRGGDAYSPEEVQFLSLVAGQIALAM